MRSHRTILFIRDNVRTDEKEKDEGERKRNMEKEEGVTAKWGHDRK